MLVLGADGILVVAVGTESDIHGLCDERNCFEETLGGRKVIYALCEGYIVAMLVVDDEEYKQIKEAIVSKPDIIKEVVEKLVKAVKG